MTGFTRIQEVAHDIGPNGRFVLRVTSADVELRRALGTTARVRVEFEVRASDEAAADEAMERSKFQVTAEPGFLEVAEPQGTEGSGIGALARMIAAVPGRVHAETVVAEVPAGAHVVVVGVSAELVVRGMEGRQEYRTVSGDAVFTDVAGDLQVNSVSGDVSLRGSGTIALRANTVSGDLNVVAPRLDRTRAVTVSGDVDIEGELSPRGEHRVETVSGDLSLAAVNGITLEVRGLSSDVSVSLPHRSEGTRDRRRYVIGDGAATVVFSTMSGDVMVNRPRRLESRVAPAAPAPPAPPAPTTPPLLSEEEQLAILKALEAGEIDVEEANRRLAGEVPHG